MPRPIAVKPPVAPKPVGQPYRLLQRQVENCQQDLNNRYRRDLSIGSELITVMDGVDLLREDIERYIREHRAVQEIKILEGRFADYRRRLKPLIAQEENLSLIHI